MKSHYVGVNKQCDIGFIFPMIQPTRTSFIFKIGDLHQDDLERLEEMYL